MPGATGRLGRIELPPPAAALRKGVQHGVLAAVFELRDVVAKHGAGERQLAVDRRRRPSAPALPSRARRWFLPPTLAVALRIGAAQLSHRLPLELRRVSQVAREAFGPGAVDERRAVPRQEVGDEPARLVVLPGREDGVPDLGLREEPPLRDVLLPLRGIPQRLSVRPDLLRLQPAAVADADVPGARAGVFS